MGPEPLAQVLRPLADMFDAGDYPELLRGLGSPDDALVWRLDDETALVLTADFFPPVVDDPYGFGAIAAANSLSDLYAMGARPLFGINLVGFPEKMDPAILSEILRGGGEKVKEAGAVVGGGHTTTDQEPKYGLAVVGKVRPDRMLTNSGAEPGDVILLTKALGTGILTTAHKNRKCEDEHLEIAVKTMSRLSAKALECLTAVDGAVHALTDVTGFALAGHAHEIAHGSGVTIRVDWDAVPLLPGVEHYARKGQITGGADRNRDFYGGWITFERQLEKWQDEVLFDPQTSGGLLAAVEREHAGAVLAVFESSGEPVARIGEVVEGESGALVIA